MADIVQMRPPEMRETASFLRAKLDAVSSEMSELKNRVDDTSSRWEGRAKNAFVPLFEETHRNVMTALTDSITGLAQGLDESANAVDATDESIASAFKG